MVFVPGKGELSTHAPTGITLNNPTPFNLTLGDLPTELLASVKPDNADPSLTWTSSNPEVAAIIDNHAVEAKAIGEATLTARSTVDTSVFSKLSVSVFAAVIHPDSIEIKTGSPLVLSLSSSPVAVIANVLPVGSAPRVQWVSQNPDIASIENGNYVKPIAVGSTWVIAKSIEDSSVQNHLQVIVQAEAIPPKKVTFANGDSVTLSLGGGAVPISASVEPDGAPQEVSFTSSDTTIVIMTLDQKIKGLKVGNALVIVTSAIDTSLSDTLRVRVQEEVILPEDLTLETASPLVLILGTSPTRLKASISPVGANPAITWSSANDKVAAIENDDLVSPIAIGETELTATSVGKPTLKKTLTVRVQAPVIAPKSITLLVPDTLYLATGGAKAGLAAKVEPAGAKQDLIWSIADTTIAQLVGDSVKPIKAGQTQAIAKVVQDPTITKSLTIEVSDPIKVDRITMQPDSLMLYSGGDSGKVIVTLQGNDAGAKYTLASSDPLIASVTAGGIVKGNTAGTAIISASPVGYPNLVANCVVTVKTDLPVLALIPAKDTTIAYGSPLVFKVSVTQQYGKVSTISADLDGNGAYDSTVVNQDTATFKSTYSTVGVINTKFEAKDSEGNVTNLVRKITVSAPGTPEITITDPAATKAIKENTYTVKFSVKDPATGLITNKDSIVTGLKEGSNTITVVRENAGGQARRRQLSLSTPRFP